MLLPKLLQQLLPNSKAADKTGTQLLKCWTDFQTLKNVMLSECILVFSNDYAKDPGSTLRR
jgi:hypothetical protein